MPRSVVVHKLLVWYSTGKARENQLSVEARQNKVKVMGTSS